VALFRNKRMIILVDVGKRRHFLGDGSMLVVQWVAGTGMVVLQRHGEQEYVLATHTDGQLCDKLLELIDLRIKNAEKPNVVIDIQHEIDLLLVQAEDRVIANGQAADVAREG